MARSYPLFVQSARVAAHLNTATQIALSLSLTAKNARAITVRAGMQAVGFRAITDFIEELAGNTIHQAGEINRTAITISKMATEQARRHQALKLFTAVSVKSKDAAYIDSLKTARANTSKQSDELTEKFKRQLWRLKDQLSETDKQIRSASVISSTSKVEASQSGEYQQQLEVIAQNIEKAAADIKEQLMIANSLLYNATQLP